MENGFVWNGCTNVTALWLVCVSCCLLFKRIKKKDHCRISCGDYISPFEGFRIDWELNPWKEYWEYNVNSN